MITVEWLLNCMECDRVEDGRMTRKTYPLKVDCAACAAKMEKKIAAIEGVGACSVNFFAAKLNIETDDDRHGEIMKEAARVIKRIEPTAVLTL